MENISIRTIIEKLESLFSKFNEQFYEGKLQKPVITVSPDTTKGAYGWCTSWKAWTTGSDSEDDGYYEINMCAEHLNRSFNEICSTLLHEMAHLYNLQNDIKDNSRGGTYHNKYFKATAETHGLIVEQHPKYGWAITKLNEEAAAYINLFNNNVFDLYRTKLSKGISTKKKQSTRKYVCPICGSIIRATKEVHVICLDCNEAFIEEM